MTNKLLVNRLNKRVTIVRSPLAGEWPSDTAIDLNKEFDAEKMYSYDDPATLFWEDIVGESGDRDEYGQPNDRDIPVCTVWASIEPLRGREYFSAMAEHAEVSTRIRIRYRDDIDRTMRVKYGEIEFEILSIIRPEYGKKELQLMCKERQ